MTLRDWFFRNEWALWLSGIFLAEMASLATIFHPELRSMVGWALAVLLCALAARRPPAALAVLAVELMIGSKGALFKVFASSNPDAGVAIRIVLVAAFLVGWATHALRYWMKHLQELREFCRTRARFALPWFALMLLCVWASIRGFALHQPFVVQDANAWGFLILLFPVLDLTYREPQHVLRRVREAVIASLIWLPFKTLGLVYVATHRIAGLALPLYLWTRRTGVGEVTLVTGNMFRVFLQSHVYAVGAFLFGVAWGVDDDAERDSIPMFTFMVLSAVSILVSLSRSFWIGLAVGGLAILIAWLSTWVPQPAIRRLKPMLRAVGASLGSLILATALLAGIMFFPYPRISSGSLTGFFGSRGSTSDAAAKSRWNLLPAMWDKIKTAPLLGSGFGATVTYQSKDPRILSGTAKGTYTTYAFEWGWLDHWLKFGVLGIPVMLWLVGSLIWRSWKAVSPWWIRAGFVSSLVALAGIHAFTPYLNHPLGFGFLLFVEGHLALKDAPMTKNATS